MNLTEKQLKDIAHISTEEVKQDLENAKQELKRYRDEKEAILSFQTPYDKTKLYFLDAKIDKGREFIDELNQILIFRERGYSRI